MKIESTDLSVEKLLTGSYFVIPRFQRPYSWEEDNIDDFWSDVTRNTGSDYFIGSMVVYNATKNTLGVVDGQQRLTTIMIFLCTLRDAFIELDETDKADGLQRFVERKNRDNRNIFVLKTESSFPYFQDVILSYEPSDLPLSSIGPEEHALAKAKEIFSHNINEKLFSIDRDPTIPDAEKLQEKVDWLTSIRDVVLELSVILIHLDNEEDAYLIFETLNTRGKDLALSDLVKNLFTRNLRARGDVDHARIKWDKVLETIFNSDADLSPDNFIVHSWQSRFDSVTKAKAYPKIREQVNPKTAKRHLDDFIFDAECYRMIFEPSYGWQKDQFGVRNSLEAFKLFKLVQPTPAVLSLVRAYRKKVIKLRMLRRTLLAIENFHFRFTAVTSSRSSGGISSMYSAFGRKLFEAEDSVAASQEIKSLIAKLKQRVPTPAEFDAAFEQITYTETATSQRPLVRYILRRLSQHERLPVIGQTEELTIEHLMPQSEMGQDCPADTVGQIGNLMFVDSKTNEKLSVRNFSEKKKILAANSYRIPAEFQEADKLTPELIRKRTENIARMAREEIWTVV